MRTDTIVGYTYDVENLCPQCTIESIIMDYTIVGKTVEETLDWLAAEVFDPPINRQKEDTFDSNTFPKIIFYSSDLAEERCAHCGEKLI